MSGLSAVQPPQTCLITHVTEIAPNTIMNPCTVSVKATALRPPNHSDKRMNATTPIVLHQVMLMLVKARGKEEEYGFGFEESVQFYYSHPRTIRIKIECPGERGSIVSV